jgi:hypothetical protein
MNRCGSSGRRARSASAVFEIFVLPPKKTFRQHRSKTEVGGRNRQSGLPPQADSTRTSRHVGLVPILLQKSFAQRREGPHRLPEKLTATTPIPGLIGFCYTTSCLFWGQRAFAPPASDHGSINTPGFIMPLGSSSRLAPRSARAKSSGRCLS